MSLSKEQLLLLDTIVYYEEFSNNNYKTVGNFIDDVKKNKEDFQTVFNDTLGKTDKDLGMDKIIDFIDDDGTLKSLVIVYPDEYDDDTTSSVCLVDPVTSDVYVIYVGNYAVENYDYLTSDGENINLST